MGYSELFGMKKDLVGMMTGKELQVSTYLESVQVTHDPINGRKADEDYIREIFGVKKGEKITKQHIRRLKKRELRKLAVLSVPLFSSNSYNYEYYKISPKDIARLASVLVKRDGVVTRDVFVGAYVKKLYGTKLYGEQLFDSLAGKDVNEVNKDVIEKNFIEAASR